MRMIIWIILWAVSIFHCASSTGFRLGRNIVPTFYKLGIFVEQNLNSFSGNVIIHLHVDKPQSYVLLHYKSDFITVKRVMLNDDLECYQENYNTTTDIAMFECFEDLITDSELKIRYEGKFEKMFHWGFYQSTFLRNNEKYLMVNTKFSPGYTRRAFPCFDEPSFKASFELSIIYPLDFAAITNTMAVSTKNISNDLKKTIFHPTPKMSPHALTIHISHLKMLSEFNMDVNGFKTNIYSEVTLAPYLGTFKKYFSEVIAKMDEWTSIPYKKMGCTQLDIIVLRKFPYAATENWGLIEFSDKVITDDNKITSISKLDSILTVLANAVAKQWFGYYVTVHWWSDIWITEGMTIFLSYHIYSENISDEDEFDLKNKFVGELLNDRAFSEDGQQTSFPLSPPENEINTIADSISCFNDNLFAKGASIIRMIYHILGESKFKNGITSYLTKRKYQTVNSQILLNALAEEAKQDNVEFVTKMDAWIHKAGFPIVTAVLDESTSEIVLTQKPFNKDVDTQWWIPISYTTSSEKNFTFKCSTWLQPNQTLKISFKDEDWIIFNLQVVGFYRVNYDDKLLNKIITALEGGDINNIHTLNRAQLIYDIFNLAAIGVTTYKRAFDLANYLRNEIEYYPWLAACTVFKDLLVRLNQTTQRLLKKKIENYMVKAFSSTQTSDGSGNKHIERLKNTLLQEWACILGKKECIDYVQEEFKKFKSSSSLSNYDNRELVFCYTLKYSSNLTDDYEFLLKLFKMSKSIVQKISILKSLGCIPNTDLLETYLNEILDGKLIDDKYAEVILDSLITNDQTEFTFPLLFFSFYESTMLKVMSFSVMKDAYYKLAGKLETYSQILKIFGILKRSRLSYKSRSRYTETLRSRRLWFSKYGNEIHISLR